MNDFGWFADYNDEEDQEPGMFQPFYQMQGGGVIPVAMWFNTKEETEDFIDTFLVGNLTRLPKKWWMN